MSLQNAYGSICHLIALESDNESKLNLLTAIGLETTNEEIFRACEEVRNQLPVGCSPTTEEIRSHILQHPVVGIVDDACTGVAGCEEETI